MTAALTLTLPGRWYEIPLGADDMPAQLRDFTRSLLGEADHGARSRALLHQRLLAVAERAQRAKAEQLHLGLALTDSVPLPAVFTVFPPVPVVTADSAEPKEVMDALLEGVVTVESDSAGGTAVADVDDRIFTVGDCVILRRPRLRFDADEGTPALLIDYWLTVPGEAVAQLVQVSMPQALHVPLYAMLFDEIMFAARREPRTTLLDDLSEGDSQVNAPDRA